MLQHPHDDLRKNERGIPCWSQRFVIAALALFCGSASLSGCVTAVKTSVPPGPAEDESYAPVVNRWTRRAHVFEKFQNRVEVTAVLLADEMRRAVADRLSRLRGTTEELSILSDASSEPKLGLLVSLFTPEGAYQNLDDKSLWSLSLRIGARQLAPTIAKRVYDKTPLLPFFSHIHQWSQDYILVFDFPEKALQRSEVGSRDVSVAEFTAQSAIAKVALTWP